ncbi:hypothetical protein F4803DRAFT_543262 [Xylaria telfairii]|nr:hypothetical protein F4803DRAFT_543262 [Xylaria telfairii]
MIWPSCAAATWYAVGRYFLACLAEYLPHHVRKSSNKANENTHRVDCLSPCRRKPVPVIKQGPRLRWSFTLPDGI